MSYLRSYKWVILRSSKWAVKGSTEDRLCAHDAWMRVMLVTSVYLVFL